MLFKLVKSDVCKQKNNVSLQIKYSSLAVIPKKSFFQVLFKFFSNLDNVHVEASPNLNQKTSKEKYLMKNTLLETGLNNALRKRNKFSF